MYTLKPQSNVKRGSYMLKIALCDDHRETVKKYATLLTKCAEKHGVEIEISCFYSGEALLFHFSDGPGCWDIIYLDILMEKTDGMETARKLRRLGCRAQIVFLTSCEDYVYEAFDVEAIQYLLKEDISEERFEKVFLRAAALATKKEEELFVCEFDGVKKTVPVGDISHFEIWRRVVTVYYGSGQSAKFYASMDQLERQFSDRDFARAHRSYLVHLPFIAQFETQRLLLKTGEIIPVGVTYMKSLKKAFSDYMLRFHINDGFVQTEKRKEP